MAVVADTAMNPSTAEAKVRDIPMAFLGAAPT